MHDRLGLVAVWRVQAEIHGYQPGDLRAIGFARLDQLLALPGIERSVRGWTAKLLILDEAAFINPETFTAARALVATGGRLVVQSTPADETGDFHAALLTRGRITSEGVGPHADLLDEFPYLGAPRPDRKG